MSGTTQNPHYDELQQKKQQALEEGRPWTVSAQHTGTSPILPSSPTTTGYNT